MTYFYNLRFYIILLAVSGLFIFISSCTQKPPVKPVEQQIEVEPPKPEIPEVIASEDIELSIIDIFIQEAEKFERQGNYQDALFVYNQAYAQADEKQVRLLTAKIENLLPQTPTDDIKSLLEYEKLKLPKSLLMYWLAWNLAFEDNYFEANSVLKQYLKQYPDHKYAIDAKSLLDIVNSSMFDRNTIGCLLPLSGKYAVFGHKALSGIQLAVKELSEKYGKNFKIIIEDTKADPEIVELAVKKLYQNNVAAIIGPLLPVREAGFVAQELGIPMIALTQKEKFPEQGDFLFSNFITPRMQVQTLGAYLFGKLGVQKVAILYPDETYGQKYMNLFWDMVDEYGAQVVGAEAYDGSKTDFSTALEKLTGKYYPLPDFLIPEVEDPLAESEDNLDHDEDKDSKPRHSLHKKDEQEIEIDFQALFIPDSPSKIKLILPQLAFNDIRDVYLVGNNLWHNDKLTQKSIRRYAKNTVIADGYFDGSNNPATQGFTQNYEKLFNKKPSFLEAIAHDTASILFETTLDENINNRSELKAALQGGKIYEGATGITLFDNVGNAHRRLFLITIKKDRFVEISD